MAAGIVEQRLGTPIIPPFVTPIFSSLLFPLAEAR